MKNFKKHIVIWLLVITFGVVNPFTARRAEAASSVLGILLIVGTTAVTVTTVWLTVKLLNKAFAPATFADKNMPALLSDISRGNGEYLATYGQLFGCKNPETLSAFSKLAQQEVVSSGDASLTGKSLSEGLARKMGAQPAVFASCGS